MAARAKRLADWRKVEIRERRPGWRDIGRALLLSLLVVLALCRVATATSAGADEPREPIVVASSEGPGREAASTRLVAEAVSKPAPSPIVYQPPRRGSPVRGKVGGGVRGGSKAFAAPLALVPGHLAYTVSASPSVFWHVDGPIEGARVFFSIMDEENMEGLDTEVEIEAPKESGIHRVRLSDLGITLEEDTEYHWFISVVPDVEMKCADDGEVLFRGPNIMKGYFKNPEATADTIRDGWLWTGDNARQDEHGYFHFVDRAKDMIKRAGENVAASEVEAVIQMHPSVFDCAVVGIPDPMRDEAIVAVVVPTEGASLEADSLIAWCAERLASFRVPERIEFRQQLPRTSVGKIQKNILRNELSEET